MTREAGQTEYARRMHKVLEHIDRHLDESLELTDLAEVAHFSAFHFHRVFAAWMGETLGDYLRRRRLETAALRLIAQPGVTVLGIALSVGFGSAEAFARAFKSRFGCTPSAWRAQEAQRREVQLEGLRANRQEWPARHPESNPDQSMGNPDQAAGQRAGHHGSSNQVLKEPAMKVQIVDRQPTHLAYLRRTGPYGPELTDFWRDAVYPWMVTNNLLGKPRYGISHDDPGITAADKCRYDACVEVPPGFVPTGKAMLTTLPGGKYAATRVFGTTARVGATWNAMLRDWLSASGMQLDARPFFEYYPPDARYDPQTGAFECDICIPVTAL
jgi:AraC family transcriptional regulator